MRTRRLTVILSPLGYRSYADFWLSDYGDAAIEQKVEAAVEQVFDLFRELHAYVRHSLQAIYGKATVKSHQPIPMHLLGNLWGQQWDMVSEGGMAALPTGFC